jgi:signal transduction histidine kinase
LALLVAAAFIVAGLAWVLLTDVLLYTFASDPVLIARVETAKGWIFVGLAAVLLYLFTLRSASRMSRARAIISTVVDSIADGVLLLGPDRRIKHANPAAARMLRCDHLVGIGADEFSRRFHVSYPDGRIVPPDQYISQRVFDEGGPLHYKALMYPPGAGELVISATAAAVRDELGEPPHLVVSVMHDITASERMERTRDEFFAAAAHALKTPVAIIKANVQGTARGDPAQLLESMAAIDRQCRRIDRLVQNLLVLARTRTQTLQLRHEDLELAPLVERNVHEIAVTYLQRAVVTDVLEKCHVRADGERLGLALRDLLDLACRLATPSSAVTVAVSRRGADAVVTVRYDALPPEEVTVDGCGAYDEIGIDRLVVQAIAAAHGWTLSEEKTGSAALISMRLPTLSTCANEHGERHPHSGG